MTDHRDVAGLEYLEAVTRVLQRRRLAEPERETWEAAEVQWWWPRDQHEDPSYARVWCDADGPAAAVIFTRWGNELGCTVLADGDFAPAWRFTSERSGHLQATAIEMEIIDRDVQTQDSYIASWLDPSEIRAPKRPLLGGYEIVSRAQGADRPHPMAARNGAEVESRLRQCSLYDSTLDLAVRAADDTIAGYALFWADPVTHVGVVEPMRVEAAARPIRSRSRSTSARAFRRPMSRGSGATCRAVPQARDMIERTRHEHRRDHRAFGCGDRRFAAASSVRGRDGRLRTGAGGPGGAPPRACAGGGSRRAADSRRDREQGAHRHRLRLLPAGGGVSQRAFVRGRRDGAQRRADRAVLILAVDDRRL
jgi:hypothetical protein